MRFPVGVVAQPLKAGGGKEHPPAAMNGVLEAQCQVQPGVPRDWSAAQALGWRGSGHHQDPGARGHCGAIMPGFPLAASTLSSGRVALDTESRE